jgi:hypothetical protein
MMANPGIANDLRIGSPLRVIDRFVIANNRPAVNTMPTARPSLNPVCRPQRASAYRIGVVDQVFDVILAVLTGSPRRRATGKAEHEGGARRLGGSSSTGGLIAGRQPLAVPR